MTWRLQTIDVDGVAFRAADDRRCEEWISGIRQLLDHGQIFLAYDLVRMAREHFPADVQLEQLAARCLLRTGAIDQALVKLESMRARDDLPADEETLGLLGRAHKDLWMRNDDPQHARMARDSYVSSFRVHRGIYGGINAATMSRILGEKVVAWALAEEVLVACEPYEGDTQPTLVPEESTRDGEDGVDYWRLATRGEALLLLDRPDEAIDAYREAVDAVHGRHRFVVSSLQQLRLLSRSDVEVPQELFEILKPPTVVVFAGHMTDKRDRGSPRFPPHLTSEVRTAIAEKLARIDASIGFCSAGCGSDILFIEAMLERNAEVHVLLPFRLEDFIVTSVRRTSGSWVQRFRRALAEADSVKYVTEERFLGDNVLFSFANTVVRGLAELYANRLDTHPHLVAVWDGSGGDTVGGTAQMVTSWRDSERRHIIPMDEILEKAGPVPEAYTKANSDWTEFSVLTEKNTGRVIRTLLFADIVGYTKLEEEHTPAFIRDFFKQIADALHAFSPAPEFINTWGDAIFAVMERTTDMAGYALALCNAVTQPDWRAKGLPPMSIRIALHAGPVFRSTDPLTGRANYYGSHVNRAARLEPITVPGCVYASEQFVAMLKAEEANEGRFKYDCQYVGTMNLPKDFGLQPVYCVRESGDG